MKKRSKSQKIQKPTVKTKGTQDRVTIGMDLGDKTNRYCMLSSDGEILRERQGGGPGSPSKSAPIRPG
jgi:hypothetical protein